MPSTVASPKPIANSSALTATCLTRSPERNNDQPATSTFDKGANRMGLVTTNRPTNSHNNMPMIMEAIARRRDRRVLASGGSGMLATNLATFPGGTDDAEPLLLRSS